MQRLGSIFIYIGVVLGIIGVPIAALLLARSNVDWPVAKLLAILVCGSLMCVCLYLGYKLYYREQPLVEKPRR